jgi:folate-binding protein YgfZ
MLTSADFQKMATHAGLFDRSDRCRLEIRGPDRTKFLHNLTTNEIKRLPAGKGCESFVTNLRGKAVGYVIVLADADRILVRADRGSLRPMIPHFEKYGVFDEVTIDDRSAATFELHLAGAEAGSLLGRAGARLAEEGDYSHIVTEIAGFPVRVIRESPTGLPGWTLIGEKPSARAVKETLNTLGREIGLIDADPETFEVLRIAAGTPVFGKDVTENSLPQEIGRDARAISFVKGCYLGQETVARLDALGHVNQVLKGLSLEENARVPASGTELEADGKRVGVVTSAAFSPARNAPVALAMVRTTHAAAGTALAITVDDVAAKPVAIVSDLPMGGPA